MVYRIITLCLIFLSLMSCESRSEERKSTSGEKAPHYAGLGDYRMSISSNSEEAKDYFNQGLILMYGYNYPEATRAFQEAARCDPKSGICHWGAAVSLAECIDNPGDKWCVEAYNEMIKAWEKSSNSTPKEQELIAAVTDRFNKRQSNYEVSNKRFIQNMKRLQKKYPNDPDIAAILSNTYMYEINMLEGMINGKATGQTKEVVDTLEEGLKKDPYHPGLNHFYIHAMEACHTPEKALDAAERLDGLVPISGHLQHMPAHIYYRFGRYHDASKANQRGIDADSKIFAEGGVKDPEFAGFYLHNHYYLFHSLTMEGRTHEALEAAKKVNERIRSGDLPSSTYLQNVYYSVPYLLMARYGMWEEIQREPAPEDHLRFTRGAWHYAMGLSELHSGNRQAAEQRLHNLLNVKRRYDMGTRLDGFNNNLSKLLEIAFLDLEGAIATAKGDEKKHISNLQKALPIEQSLYIGMLPWYLPINHALGQAYLEANMPDRAEYVYKTDLKTHPNNGWALYGLIQSLKAQNRYVEIAKIDDQQQENWKYSDITLKGSRF